MTFLRSACILVFFVVILPVVQPGFLLAKSNQNPETGSLQAKAASDSLYDAHHPCLLLTPAELPALRAKLQDGGEDDNAYNFIKIFVDVIYPGSSYQDLLGTNFGLGTIPNLGLVTHIESPQDTAARALGKDLTLYVANNWNIDNDVYYSSLRLRTLSLGYDMFFANSNAAERDLVKNEILSYIDTMLTDDNYTIYEHRPYLSNKSAMIAGSLGLAAICLQSEIDTSKVESALAMADRIINTWLYFQVGENGAYNEGVLYAGWSLKLLVYYFYARQRYDGYNFADHPKIRNMEKWFVYELLPEGNGLCNNLNDSSYYEWILSQNNTYFDWAQSEWGSGLSSWIWEHTTGDYGYDYGVQADKVATALWHENLVPTQPDSVLPKSFLWEHRGLYYFRTGWQSGLSSDDVMFSFYSGEFQGGHAQEDQNQFTLYGYGAKFAIDNGIGTVAKQSEAHNMVFIDGKGQHNAGSSIGTDGKISQFLISSYADYLRGDATSAYTTYSSLNNPNFPVPGADWSWGYDGGNPVQFALRNFIIVHDETAPPYFFLFDDIEKDGSAHEYEWRMHTLDGNDIDTTSNPVRITDGASFLDIHVLNPSFDSLVKQIEPFNNMNADPNSNIISLSVNEVNPRFAMLMLPGDDTFARPAITQEQYPWGLACTVDWGSGKHDVLLINYTGAEIIYTATDSTPAASALARNERTQSPASVTTSQVLTDADMALLRIEDGFLKKYLLANATVCAYDDTAYVSIANGPTCVALSGDVINIDRYDADFTFYAPAVNSVYYRNQQIPIVKDNGYLTRDLVTGVTEAAKAAPLLCVDAYPNPFNPTTTIRLNLRESGRVSVVIYDVMGRSVKTLCKEYLDSGVHLLRWDGTNAHDQTVASGVYFVRAVSRGSTQSVKVTVLK